MADVKRWVLASGNKGKVTEFQSLFESKGVQIVPQSEFDVIEAEETGLSFIENAIIKARNASLQTGLPALADDSGLEVSALKGEPGIYSARYASDTDGKPKGDQANNRKLLSAMHDRKDRAARFVCALAFMRHPADPTPVIAQGYWEGEILTHPTGEGGFGYDPLFFDTVHRCSAAEMDRSIKNKAGHRGKAMETLFSALADENLLN